jgi:hypothetical protein
MQKSFMFTKACMFDKMTFICTTVTQTTFDDAYYNIKALYIFYKFMTSHNLHKNISFDSVHVVHNYFFVTYFVFVKYVF